jgi:hypothetical protein
MRLPNIPGGSDGTGSFWTAGSQDAVAQRESLAGVVGNSSVEGGMSDGNTGRCRDDPSKMLPVLIPQLYAKRQVAGNVMQVGVGQFA